MPAATSKTELAKGSSFWEDIQTIPNILSISRIVATFIGIGLYLNEMFQVGLIIATIAGITDVLDGQLARRLNQTTELGAILDRQGDLVLETAGLATVLFFDLLPPVFLIMYLSREYVVISARQYAAERGSTIPSSLIGKLKTSIILIAFLGVMGPHAGFVTGYAGEVVFKIGQGLMVAGLVASYISGIQYLSSFVRVYDRHARRPQKTPNE